MIFAVKILALWTMTAFAAGFLIGPELRRLRRAQYQPKWAFRRALVPVPIYARVPTAVKR